MDLLWVSLCYLSKKYFLWSLLYPSSFQIISAGLRLLWERIRLYRIFPLVSRKSHKKCSVTRSQSIIQNLRIIKVVKFALQKTFHWIDPMVLACFNLNFVFVEIFLVYLVFIVEKIIGYTFLLMVVVVKYIYNVSGVTSHMSCVICKMSLVTCHM